MLRIHVEARANAVQVWLEGKLVRPWTDELVRTWMDQVAHLPPNRRLVVDLSDVTFVDAQGKVILASMRRSGCELQASTSTPFITAILEDLEPI